MIMCPCCPQTYDVDPADPVSAVADLTAHIAAQHDETVDRAAMLAVAAYGWFCA